MSSLLAQSSSRRGGDRRRNSQDVPRRRAHQGTPSGRRSCSRTSPLRESRILVARTNESWLNATAVFGHDWGSLAGSLAAVAKRKRNSSNDAGSTRPAPSSRTNGPAGGARKPKGRVPVAANSSRNTNEAAAEGNGEADSGPEKKKYPYGAGALILIFIAAQAISSVIFGFVQSRTSYDFTSPAGVGAAVGQASRQFAEGQSLEISVPPPLWLTALMQIPLWVGLGGAPVWFAVKKGKGIVADLGLRMKLIDVPVGLAIGVARQLLLVPFVYFLLRPLLGENDVSAAARELTDRATDPLSIALVFLIVGIGAPVAEEIYFRGMAQRIFGRRLGPWAAILAAAAFFAATHLQPLQFPALLLFGVLLGFMTWKSGRLGPALWTHVGFNVVAAAGLLFSFGPI